MFACTPDVKSLSTTEPVKNFKIRQNDLMLYGEIIYKQGYER